MGGVGGMVGQKWRQQYLNNNKKRKEKNSMSQKMCFRNLKKIECRLQRTEKKSVYFK